MRAVLNLGIDPAQILFANPCKAAASLVFAQRARIFRTTFDNIDELDTIKRHMPEAQLFLRIYANDDTALIGLGEKFGASLDATPALLARARELKLHIIGISFHVGMVIHCLVRGCAKKPGTGARNPQSFCKAIRHARIAFSQAQNLGYRPTILDIGGGFLDDSFDNMTTLIRETIRSEFPDGVVILAEPGRFYARSAYTLVCRVIARRRQIGTEPGVPDMLYQNDGVYGNFMNVIMEKELVVPNLITKRKSDTKQTAETKTGPHRYSIWGPTCDSVDCVVREVTFDSEVCIGDWLRYENMGGTFELLKW